MGDFGTLISLAAKHYFGAKTGGANISIGIIEILAGLFLAGLVALVFAEFPEATISAMILLNILN